MKVLTVIPVTQEDKDLIESASSELEYIYNENPSAEEIHGADIILGNASSVEIAKNKNLKWLQTNSAGVEPYIKEGVLPNDCLLSNATGGYGLAISEHLLAMYLMLTKKFHLYRDEQKNSNWTDLGLVSSVYGSTVLILGMGDIGTEFAKRCKAMGAYVIGVRRTDTSASEFADEIHLNEELDTLLPRADCVAIALPGTKETAGLMGKERLALMKDSAVLLNVGRGTVIDTEALCEALENGKLMGAGLDVTDPEPLPKEHKLWHMSNVFITPHVSGGYHLKETHRRIIEICATNLKSFLNGEKLKNIVDFETGYRKL